MMKMKNKTGWYEEDGIWYLYHEGKVLAVFCLTEHSNPTKAMCDIKIINKYAEEFELQTGLADEAKAIIENIIISYAAERVAEWSKIRYTVVKTAGERNELWNRNL